MDYLGVPRRRLNVGYIIYSDYFFSFEFIIKRWISWHEEAILYTLSDLSDEENQ